MNIIELLARDNYIMYNIQLAQMLGVNEAIMMGELARKWNYWNKEKRLENDGYFYITQEEIEKDTGLSPYQQRQATKTLVDKEFIEVKLQGIPAVNHFKILENKLLSNLVTSCEETKPKMLKNFTTRCEKTSQLDVKKLDTTNTVKTNTVNTNTRTNTSTVPVETQIINYLSQEGKSADFISAFTMWYNKVKKESWTLKLIQYKLVDLYKIYDTEEEQIKCIVQSWDKGWCSFYEMPKAKEKVNPPTPPNEKEEDDYEVEFGDIV